MNETFETTKSLKDTFHDINQKELENFADKMKNIKTTIRHYAPLMAVHVPDFEFK